MNKRALFFIVVIWYCDGSFDSFCIIIFDRVVLRCSTLHCFLTRRLHAVSSEILPLHDFIVRQRLRVIYSCDFVRRCRLRANLPPSHGLDSEICVCKLAEKLSPLIYALK
jgi:hypothetical protein